MFPLTGGETLPVIGSIVIVAVVLLLIVRLVWRLRNEQLEPGGSWGQQIFGRTRDQKPDDV